MMRRALWLAVGAAAGASGALWSSRRLGELSQRARSGALPGDVLHLARRGSARVARRVAGAVDTGRSEASRRRHELDRALQPRR